MGKKYIATIMNRHLVGESTFIYSVSHTVIGEIDQKTGILRDRNGNEYAQMLSPELMKTEIPYCYTNIKEYDKLKEAIGTNSMQDAIGEYEYICRNIIYYVGLLDSGSPYCVPLNIADLKESSEEQYAKIIHDKKKQAKAQEKGKSSKKQESCEAYPDDYDDYDEENYYATGDMNPELQKLVLDIVNGEYSLEELVEMREQLRYDSADIDDVLLTLDVQIEAMQNGTSCVNMTEEEIVAAKEKLREEEEDKVVESLHKNEERINIDELFKKVTTTLIAQDKAARRVIAEIARKESNPSKKKDGILLTGPTGVGKTELMRLISEYIDRPFFTIDANQITSPGYVGKDIEEYLWDLYEACGEDLEKAEHAIVFFDEIDKKGSSRKDDPSGQSVLNSLLTFIEGTTYDATPDTRLSTRKVKISTKNMTKILVGAFTDVYDHLDDNKPIGFGTDSTSRKPKTEPTIDDFVKKGLMTKEYMGRVLVVKLDDLDVNSLRRILLESDKSALKIQEKIFAKIGTKITFTDSYTTKVATKALNNKTGARGLSTIVDNSTWEAFEEVYKHPGEYSEVILDEDSVEDSSHYQLVKKQIKKNISE